MRLWTIGYEKRRPTGLVETLKAAGVTLVIDVRLSAASRLPEWTASELDHALDVAGIRYRHRPALGNRWHPHGRAVSKAEGDEILARYREHLATDKAAIFALDLLCWKLGGDAPPRRTPPDPEADRQLKEAAQTISTATVEQLADFLEQLPPATRAILGDTTEAMLEEQGRRPRDRICLLCYCRSSQRCHRGPIVEALRRRLPELQVTHL